MVPSCLTMCFFLLSISAPTGPCYDLQMGWWDTACYSVYFSSVNRCRCTHCWNGFPWSLQLLIILLKWLCICHNLHIKIICFAYTELFKLFVVNSWLNWVWFAVYKSSPDSSQFYGDVESPKLNILQVSVALGHKHCSSQWAELGTHFLKCGGAPSTLLCICLASILVPSLGFSRVSEVS